MEFEHSTIFICYASCIHMTCADEGWNLNTVQYSFVMRLVCADEGWNLNTVAKIFICYVARAVRSNVCT